MTMGIKDGRLAVTTFGMRGLLIFFRTTMGLTRMMFMTVYKKVFHLVGEAPFSNIHLTED
jgi:hypothetical protein